MLDDFPKHYRNKADKPYCEYDPDQLSSHGDNQQGMRRGHKFVLGYIQVVGNYPQGGAGAGAYYAPQKGKKKDKNKIIQAYVGKNAEAH